MQLTHMYGEPNKTKTHTSPAELKDLPGKTVQLVLIGLVEGVWGQEPRTKIVFTDGTEYTFGRKEVSS